MIVSSPKVDAVAADDSAETGAPKGAPGIVTCPHCRYSWGSESTYRTLVEELEGWDRRFDGPDTIVDAVLDLLSVE